VHGSHTVFMTPQLKRGEREEKKREKERNLGEKELAILIDERKRSAQLTAQEEQRQRNVSNSIKCSDQLDHEVLQTL